ncbi:hypothetical protein [Paenibacillus sp. PAMC21692]|uniref:hypothetical protein n=1 Tax=Paenibacillus sp. PAMC21692 TaxID=2762320 RepID=UPI00164DA81C|nr:hypothetical protein [Paenibacillus sp. PAMC21692]QNK59622.1 hypothetical protein H7F31_12610 [Paenibacillus sp. PAMC21692]
MKKTVILILLCACLALAGCKGGQAERESNAVTPQPTLQTMQTVSVTPVPTSENETTGAIDRVETENGFRLATDGTYNPFQLFTAASDEGTSYVVHVLTSNESLEHGVRYGAIAAVVHPNSGEFRTYPLFSAIINDSYAAHSIAKAYGMLDSRHLLYIAVHDANDEGEVQSYSVEKLDITSGEKTIIVPAIQELDSISQEEHFAPGWMTTSGESLVLNSYSEGKLWAIDIADGEVRQLPKQTKHSWPFFLTSVSPDGELIWHLDSDNSRFVLLDLEGNERSTVPFSSEAIRGQNGWFYWSPNGKYAIFDDSSASEQNPVIYEDSEFSVKAMNKLNIYTREGNGRSIMFDRSKGQFVEVAGWLGAEDEYAVLRFYDVEGASASLVPDSVSFLLLHLPTGGLTSLQPNADRLPGEKLELASLYKSRPGLREPLLLVDLDSHNYVLLSDSGAWAKQSSNEASKRAWIEAASQLGGTLLHWEGKDDTRGLEKESLVLQENVREISFAGENWIVTEDMVYIRMD